MSYKNSKTFTKSEPPVPPLPLEEVFGSVGGKSGSGKQKLKKKKDVNPTVGYGDSLLVDKNSASHATRNYRTQSQVVVGDAKRLGALPPVNKSTLGTVTATHSWAGQHSVPPVLQNDSALVTTTTNDTSGAMIPNPPSFPKGGPLAAVTSSVSTTPGDGVVAKTARAAPANHNMLKAPPSDFNNTFSSTTSIDTLQGRIKALEGAVAKTPRLDPIASWPVKPSGSLVAASNKKGGLQNAARPPLAVEVESFIRKEMLELTMAVKNPTHLQMIPIFREAFSCLINHFTEYHSILSLIKTEYDSVIGDLSLSHHHLTRLQTEMRSLKEVYTVQLQEEREKLGTTISDLQAQLAAALKANHNQRVLQIKLEKEIVTLTESVNEKNADIDDAQDRIRLLTSTTRELGAKNSNLLTKLGKAQTQNEHLTAMVQALQEKIKSELSGGSINVLGDANNTQHSEGPINHAAATGKEKTDFTKVLKEAVLTSGTAPSVGNKTVQRDNSFANSSAVAATAMSSASNNTNALIAMLDDNAQSRQDIHDRNLKLEGKITDLRRTIVDLRSQVANLMRRIKQMQDAREDDTLTPRPKWITVTHSMPEFHLNHLQTSEEILEELVSFTKEKLHENVKKSEREAYSKAIRQWLDDEDLCESDLVVKNKYFIGKGTGPHIPPCLRWSGRVRNRKIKKGDVETLLGKFWNERRQLYRTESIVNVKKMQDHFNDWLVQQTGGTRKAIELAYNIFNVCEQHLSDPDCSMFLKIFRGEISEAAIFDQFETVNKLREIVEKHDKTKMGAVSRFTMQRIMTAFFKAKSMEDMLRLRFALVISCKGSAMVDYNTLFAEDEDGNQSRFVELLRRQHVQEISSFVVEVEEELRKVATDTLADSHDDSSQNASPPAPTSPQKAHHRGGHHNKSAKGVDNTPHSTAASPKTQSPHGSPTTTDLVSNNNTSQINGAMASASATFELNQSSTTKLLITMSSARLAIKGLDHKMPDERINEVLAYACGFTPLEFASVGNMYSTELEPFLARIRCGLLLKRHSPRPDEDEDGAHADDSDDEGRRNVGSLLEDGFFTEAELKQVAALMDDGSDENSDGDDTNLVDVTQPGGLPSMTSVRKAHGLKTPGDASKGRKDGTRQQSMIEFNSSTSVNHAFGVTAVQGSKEDREREAKNRRAVTMEQEISDALQQQEKERQEELEKRSRELDTFSLFAAHPSAAASVNLSSLEQKRKEAAAAAAKLEMEQSRRKENEEKMEELGVEDGAVDEKVAQPVKEKDVEQGVTFKKADDDEAGAANAASKVTEEGGSKPPKK